MPASERVENLTQGSRVNHATRPHVRVARLNLDAAQNRTSLAPFGPPIRGCSGTVILTFHRRSRRANGALNDPNRHEGPAVNQTPTLTPG